MEDEVRRKEINEAIRAGYRALESLRRAEGLLASAKNWGILDMMGGGLFTSFVKHSKIDDASAYIERAKTDLKRFQQELGDIPDCGELTVDIGSFLSFADFFLDGFFVDYLVQGKINEARNNVQEAIRRVEAMMDKLRRLN